MKITFAIQDLFGLGAQYVTASMVRGFVAKGYEVDLIVSKVHEDLQAEGKIKPFEVPASVKWIHLHSRKARENIGELRHYLKTAESQVVIAMSPNYTEALAIAALGLRHCPTLVHIEHSGGGDVTLDGDAAPPLTMLQRLRRWVTFRRYAAVGGVSTGTLKSFRNLTPWFKGRMGVVYNPVIDEVFHQKVADGAAEVHPWLREKICPTFVAAGAHSPLKNHMLLLQAFEKCQATRKVRLVLFGRGDLTEDYERFVREHHLEDVVSIAGFTNNLPAQLKHADGAIVSSNVESFSVVLVEALACGIPTISTNCAYGPPEILKGGEYGLLVPIKDVDAMAQAVLKVADGQGIVAPEESWNRFTLEKAVEYYEDLIFGKPGNASQGDIPKPPSKLRSSRLWMYGLITRLLPETRFLGFKVRLLRWCGATIGSNVRISSSAVFIGDGSLVIGDDVWIGARCHIAPVGDATITLGSCIDIAPQVMILTGSHEVNPEGPHAAGEGTAQSVTVGDGTWLCARSTILPGVTLPLRCIVAAGAVVTQSVSAETCTVLGGVPAKVVKAYP